MKAVILAAGEGSRMRPLTYTRPKVMLPIANKPILEHLLIEAKEAGVQEFILIVGYHDEQIRRYFGDGSKWGISIKYRQQRRQLGTADAIRMVEGSVSGNFLMINGDIVVDRKDISGLIHRQGNTMSLIKVENNRDLGVVELKKDRVVHIYEKVENPPSNMANAGLYLFTPEIFTAIAETPKSLRGEYEITDSLQWMIDHGEKVIGHRIISWLDLSYPWDLLKANESLLSTLKAKNLGVIEKNAVIKGSVSIGKGTEVRSGSYIIGPVVIGEDCEIGPNCYIRPCTAIGDSCHIGASVEIKNSIIMRGSKIPHHNYVGDSVIGEDCNLGAGTKIANLRLNEDNIVAADINTGRRKLGTIMGDNVKTGINASINVGAMIGNNTHIGPGAVVGGVIAPDSEIF
ncbi:MAG: bifunctional sugar-1-phosphate nucleotidylyltransferase/acetyltransferase [Chloroflexota bacterium]